MSKGEKCIGGAVGSCPAPTAPGNLTVPPSQRGSTKRIQPRRSANQAKALYVKSKLGAVCFRRDAIKPVASRVATIHSSGTR